MSRHLTLIFACTLFGGCHSSPLNNQPPSGSNFKTSDLPEAWQSPNIFKQYNAKGNSTLSDTWTNRFDASGISFNDKRTCTLITPRHVVMAKHYQRPVLAPVIFHDRRGKRVARHLIAVNPAYGDVSIGLLNESVPSNIRVYPLPRPSSGLSSRLTDQHVLVTDQHRRIFIHQIARVSESSIQFKYDLQQKNGYRKKLVNGDSGNPSFIMHRGNPVLVETQTSGGPGAGPFYGDAKVQSEIARIISETDNSYSLKTVTW